MSIDSKPLTAGELEEMERDYTAPHVVISMTAVRHDVARLLATVRQMEQDRKRIEWLDANREPHTMDYLGQDGEPAQHLLGFGWGIHGPYNTVREAIDAAMSSGAAQ